MRVLGLTGGIGMGKSTAAAMFAAMGAPVFDADAAVHRMQDRGGRAVAAIGAAFPGVVAEGRVVRERLRAAVIGDEAAIKRLERIVHPLVREAERGFLARARRRGVRLVVLDIPLLFETGGEGRVDAVVVVSAPASLQRARVLRRPGMTVARFEAIKARQVPDAEKRRRADHVVRSGLGRWYARRAVGAILRRYRER